MRRVLFGIGWLSLAIAAIVLICVFALIKGETINAAYVVLTAILVLFIAYRYYSLFIANRVLKLNKNAMTPARFHNDGLDYVPTNRYFLFGHHFAAIAGAGPLVGPVLAAQMGYFPGFLWILVGVVFAGAVQDFFVLTISVRNDARSLGELIKIHFGWFSGLVAMFSILAIMIMILGVLALIVVKAVQHSPWSFFAVAMTIPIGILMGIYLRFIRPGKIIEVSLIGIMLLIAVVILGRMVAVDPFWAKLFDFSDRQLFWMLVGYGFVAAVLPVWLLLAPRDYLSTFLKVGFIVALAVATLFIAPKLKMPPITQFIDGTGPVWSSALFPFLFITIACGAVSGFHALIASGTTPKMLAYETDARLIGYGGMLMETFVAIMALVAASCLDPGIYFAINSPSAIIGHTVESAAQTISSWGFVVTPAMLTEAAHNIGETTILSRVGGAPSLAVGIAQIFANLFSGKAILAFWYHFAILFEAIFILTAVDAGTRVGRFMLQDFLGTFFPKLHKTESWISNILATVICVGAWGYFLYQGIVDPLGGINTLWPLFGIANQMLAAIALIFISVILVKMRNVRYIWVTLVPTIGLLICTLTAAWQKIFSPNPKIGFLAHATIYDAAVREGNILAPAHDLREMVVIIFNDRIDAALAIFFSVLIIYMLLRAIFVVWRQNRAGNSLSPIQ